MSATLLLTATLLGTHGCAGHGVHYYSHAYGPPRVVRYVYPAGGHYAPAQAYGHAAAVQHSAAYRPEAGRGTGAAVVHMTDRARFEPAQVTIDVGETVEWRSASRHAHTVTADPRRAKNRAVLPEGAEPFHSGEIPPGGRFAHTFTVPGTYYYVCLPHEGRGMVGIVVVNPAGEAQGRRGGGY